MKIERNQKKTKEKTAKAATNQQPENEKKTKEITVKAATSQQHENKKKKKWKVIAYILSVLLICLALVFGSAFGVLLHYYSLMDTDNHDFDYSNAVSLTDNSADETPGKAPELPEENIYSDSKVFNILLIGTDERTEEFDPYARADSIMVLSLNKQTHDVKLISLERGMTVSMPGNRHDLLTHTFHYGGEKLVMETVRTHFNLDTERYIRVNFTVFEKLINYLGGVDVNLSAKEAEYLNKTFSFELTEGKNHLDGYIALQYSRLREIDSDWQRIKRQRKVIASIKNELKNKSVLELNQIISDCLPNVKTNLSSVEFADLVLNLSNYTKGDFKEMTLPKKGTYKGLGYVDFKANSQILREFIYG